MINLDKKAKEAMLLKSNLEDELDAYMNRTNALKK